MAKISNRPIRNPSICAALFFSSFMPSSKRGARARREGLRTRMPASGGRVVSPPTRERVADALAWELRCVCRAAVEGVDRRVGCAEAFTVLRARQIVPSGWHEPLAPVFRVADRPRPLPTCASPRASHACTQNACVRACSRTRSTCVHASQWIGTSRSQCSSCSPRLACVQTSVRACVRACGGACYWRGCWRGLRCDA